MSGHRSVSRAGAAHRRCKYHGRMGRDLRRRPPSAASCLAATPRAPPQRSGRRSNAMTINLSPAQGIAILGVLLAVVMVWRSGTRRGRRAADAAHMASRLASLLGYVLGTTAMILGAQWLAIT